VLTPFVGRQQEIGLLLDRFEQATVGRGQAVLVAVELAAATSLGRLLRDRGRRDEAQRILAPVYDWFTEGFDTRDLKDAQALLVELA
jgi:predicted ATPase